MKKQGNVVLQKATYIAKSFNQPTNQKRHDKNSNFFLIWIFYTFM